MDVCLGWESCGSLTLSRFLGLPELANSLSLATDAKPLYLLPHFTMTPPGSPPLAVKKDAGICREGTEKGLIQRQEAKTSFLFGERRVCNGKGTAFFSCILTQIKKKQKRLKRKDGTVPREVRRTLTTTADVNRSPLVKKSGKKVRGGSYSTCRTLSRVSSGLRLHVTRRSALVGFVGLR